MRHRATPGLFLLMSFAVIIVVALESAFIATESWALLPAIMLVLIGATAVVALGVSRALDDPDGAGRPQPAPEPVAAARRRPARPVLGH